MVPTRSGVPDGRASRTACLEPRCSRSMRESRGPKPPRGRTHPSFRCGGRGSARTSFQPPTARSSRSAGCPTRADARAIALDMADRLDALLAGRTMSANEAGHALGLHHPNQLRYAALTGRVLIRWDGAKRPTIWTVPAPDVDPLEARAELARRYLHVFGPGTAEAFAEWAGIKPPRGRAAFEAIGDSLTAVQTPIGDGWILSEDEASFSASPRPAAAARLLPSGDAYYLLQGSDRELLVPQADRRSALWTSRVWPGAVLIEGEVVGVWRRANADLTIQPWRRRLSCGTLRGGDRSGLVPAPRPRRFHPRAMGGPCVVVGARGFEPPTPWPPAKCAARLRHAPTERESGPVYGPPRRASRSAPGHVSISADSVRRVAVRPMTTSVQAIRSERRTPSMAAKIIHVEVAGKDGPKLQQFYSDVFDWDLDTNNPGGYGLLRQGEMTAGIGPAQNGGDGSRDLLREHRGSQRHAGQGRGGRRPGHHAADRGRSRDDHRALHRSGGPRRRPDVAGVSDRLAPARPARPRPQSGGPGSRRRRLPRR